MIRLRPAKPPAAAHVKSGGVAPVRLRRGRINVLVGLVLIALGGLLGRTVIQSLNRADDVIAVRSTIYRGQQIQLADLTDARAVKDSAVITVPASRKQELIGKRAKTDLPAGSFLSPASVTDLPFPAKGQAVVGLPLTTTQMPTTTLHSGDQVDLITTPRSGDDPTKVAPKRTRVTVRSVTRPGTTNQSTSTAITANTGRVILDVTVSAKYAPTLVARAATGRLSLVLVSGAS